MVIFIGLPSSSYAHLEAGEDKTVEGYLVDFGYSPKDPIDNEKIALAFNLLNSTTSEVIGPESVWVRISTEDNVVFSGTFKPEAQHVAFIYIFPHAGDYMIESTFKSKETAITRAEFQVIIGNPKYYYIFYSLFIVLGIAILILILLLIKTKKKV